MATKLFLWFSFYLVLAGRAEILREPSGAVPMKKYTINMDQTPQERWIPLLKDFTSSAPLIVNYFKDQVLNLFCCIHRCDVLCLFAGA